MYSRLLMSVFLAFVLATLVPGLSPSGLHPSFFQGRFFPAAQAQSGIRDLLSRLRGERLPSGIIKTNGRLEATQVDISAKYPGRLAEVDVEEGSNVTEGQVVGRIDSPEFEARLRGAQSNLQRAVEAKTQADAEVDVNQSALDFARTDLQRAQELIKSGTISQQLLDQRRRNFQAAEGSTRSAVAQRDQALSAVRTAAADVQRIDAVLQDLVLVSPRSGRIQYQLARTGEVVAAGAKILTVLDLKDVYMTVFLPAADAAKLELGGEARIILDPVPEYVVPATVSFVAADAQFTPKSVETREERQKLMFRVKLKIDSQVLEQYYQKVKTGVRGMGIVRTNKAIPWPDDLQTKLPK